MLPSDLLMYRYASEEIIPKRLELKKAFLEQAAHLIELFAEALQNGLTRGELGEQLSVLEGDDTGYRIQRGLAHILLTDFSEFEVDSPLEPIALRERVFGVAAKGLLSTGRTPQTLEAIAQGLSSELNQEIQVEQLERGLYADLPENRRLSSFNAPTPEALLHRFNLAQVQGVFYRCYQLKLTVYRNSQAEYKNLFRYLKLFGLMHHIEGDAETGFSVTLDGAASLFRASTRYGLAMAKLLPALLNVSKWSLEALLRPKADYGEALELARFALDSDCGLVSHYKKGELYDSALEEAFADKWNKTQKDWALEREVDLLPLPGGGLMIPDFRLHHPDGRSFLLEIVGYWRTDYLKKKFFQIRNSGRADLVVAVSERLNLDKAGVRLEDLGDKVIWFKGALLPDQVLKVLEG